VRLRYPLIHHGPTAAADQIPKPAAQESVFLVGHKRLAVLPAQAQIVAPAVLAPLDWHLIILAYLSIGDRYQELERLVSALAEIRRRYQTDGSGLMNQEYIDPEVVTSPQEAFYADKKSVPLEESVGRVCSEFVMCYPPGIPILAPGERITAEILDYIRYAKAKGCSMTGPEDPDIAHINILTEEVG